MNTIPGTRTGTLTRTTGETRIQAAVTLDGVGKASVRTGLGFLDHMITSLACHSGIDITLACEGDLAVDDHHSVEDCAIVLGRCLASALGERKGIARFGHAYAPLDESLARVVVDLVQRPCACVSLDLKRENLGDVACENLTHFFRTLATEGRFTLHVDVIRGENDHHKAEAAFKALALALRTAIRPTQPEAVASTKGTL